MAAVHQLARSHDVVVLSETHSNDGRIGFLRCELLGRTSHLTDGSGGVALLAGPSLLQLAPHVEFFAVAVGRVLGCRIIMLEATWLPSVCTSSRAPSTSAATCLRRFDVRCHAGIAVSGLSVETSTRWWRARVGFGSDTARSSTPPSRRNVCFLGLVLPSLHSLITLALGCGTGRPAPPVESTDGAALSTFRPCWIEWPASALLGPRRMPKGCRNMSRFSQRWAPRRQRGRTSPSGTRTTLWRRPREILTHPKHWRWLKLCFPAAAERIPPGELARPSGSSGALLWRCLRALRHLRDGLGERARKLLHIVAEALKPLDGPLSSGPGVLYEQGVEALR